MIDKTKAYEFIDRITKLGSKPGLSRIKMLLGKLGNPEKSLKVVHVAGTNGKGSVCAMVNSALINSGFKVGKFQSPVVFSEYEMYTINNDEISEVEYLGFISTIMEALEDVDDGDLPTLFEVQVAIAILFFSSNHVDIAIIETGMGGEEDATNVFSEVLCSVVTPIGFDHMQFLGDNLTDIARQKAGIMKKGCYALSAKQEDEVIDALNSYASEIEAKLQFVDYNHIRFNASKNMVTYREFKNVSIPFFGDFQIDNTVLALETLHILKYQRLHIDVKKACEGVSNATLPGRMEKISEKPLVYIDGCHNEAAAKSIKETINNHFIGKDITFIMGVLKDKEVSKMLNILLPLGKSLVTVTPDNERALPAGLLANDCFNYDIDVTIASDFDDAAKKAKDYDNDVIIALGSLSYLKDIKEAFLNER